MKIRTLTQVLGVPLLLLFAFIVYLNHDQQPWPILNYLLIPILLALAMLYIFSPQINFWWNQKHPVPLDDRIKKWLQQYSRFYNHLSDSDKQKFEDRLSLFMQAKEMKVVGEAEQYEMPEDMKAIICHDAIRLTFGLEEYLTFDYPRIIAYNHAFPSPQYQHLHTVERHKEDKVLIFSSEHVVATHLNPKALYNVSMHGYIEMFMELHPDISFPTPSEVDVETLETVSGFSLQKVKDTIGFKEVDLQIVAANYFFCFPKEFCEQLPELYNELVQIFRPIDNNVETL